MLIDSCLIIKNEPKIGTLIDQFHKFSNEIHITDTGSTDNTLDILNSLTKKYDNLYIHQYKWDMDFSKARNYSLTCYECKADYQFWCDSDDLLNDKLIETLTEFSNNKEYNDDIYYIKYKYFYEDTNPHIRTSLLKVSSGLSWNDPIHEFIALRPELKLNFNVFDNGSLILHQHSRDKLGIHNDRNLNIFFNMERIGTKFTARNRYYYGRELCDNQLRDLAINEFHRCIDDYDSNMDQMYCIPKLFMCNDPLAVEYTEKLMKRGLCRRDFFYYLGNYYFNNKNNKLAKVYYLMCVEYDEPNAFENFDYNIECFPNSLLQLGLIEYNNGHIDKSLYYNEKILETYPNHTTAISNINILKNLS